jgi:hypothetical protein
MEARRNKDKMKIQRRKILKEIDGMKDTKELGVRSVCTCFS